VKLPDLSGWSTRAKVALLAGVVVAFLAVCALVGWACLPVYTALQDPANQVAFESWVGSLGVLGVALMLLIQVLQIVIAFIPGEVVQVLAGAMYGTWGGLLLCLVGCVLASGCVFAIIRRFGRGLVVRLFGEDKLNSFEFLNDSEKLDTLVFVLFLIPGMPKDTLTYIVPLSNIKLSSFLVLSTVARIPGMVASTLIGSSITDANWPLIVAVFVVVVVAGLLGIWKKDALMGWAKHVGGVRPGRGE
jgi:uncharacterized membrane protein YdjX (TVP38/TMEM64 family)